MTDIFDKSFTITGYQNDKQRCCETGHDIESVGQGVVEALDLDTDRVVVNVEKEKT